MPPPIVPAPITADLARSSRVGVSAGTSGILRGRALGEERVAQRLRLRASASARMKSSRSNFRPSSNGFVDGAATASTHFERRREVPRHRRRRVLRANWKKASAFGCSTLQVAHQRQRPRVGDLARANATRAARAGRRRRSRRTAAVPGSFASTALDRLAADDHVERGLDAEHARQALRAAGARQQAELHFRQRDLRARRGDAVVAAERQLEPAAHADAVDRGDDRLGARSRARGSRCSRFGSASALGEPNSRDVGAARERLAGAGDDDRLDRRRRRGARRARRRCRDARRVAQAVDRRIVQRDDGDVAAHLVVRRSC